MRSGSCTSIRAMSKAVIRVSFRPLRLKCKGRLWPGRRARLTVNASPLTAIAKAPSTGHAMLSVARGGRAHPALERPGEGALLGEPRQERDLGKRMALVAQEPLGQIAAGVFGQGLEAHAVVGKTPVKRARAQAQAARDVRHPGRALAERLRDGVLGAGDQPGLPGDLRQLGIEMRDQVTRNPLVSEDVRLLQRLPRE